MIHTFFSYEQMVSRRISTFASINPSKAQRKKNGIGFMLITLHRATCINSVNSLLPQSPYGVASVVPVRKCLSRTRACPHAGMEPSWDELITTGEPDSRNGKGTGASAFTGNVMVIEPDASCAGESSGRVESSQARRACGSQLQTSQGGRVASPAHSQSVLHTRAY